MSDGSVFRDGKDFWDRGYSSNQKVLWIKENHRIAEENGIQDSFVERDRKFVLKGVGILEFVGYFFSSFRKSCKRSVKYFLRANFSAKTRLLLGIYVDFPLLE